VLVAVFVGVDVAVLVGVLVLVGVGVGLRHTPLTQIWPGVQQVFPHVVVPRTQAQRRRPVASVGKHVLEQQFPALRQIVPPGRQTAAASPVVERSTFAVGTPSPRARAAPPSTRRRSCRRLWAEASSRASRSNWEPSMGVSLPRTRGEQTPRWAARLAQRSRRGTRGPCCPVPSLLPLESTPLEKRSQRRGAGMVQP
jgi:hypothetical protein